MKKILTLAALIAGLCLATPTAEADDWHHGHHVVHHGSHGVHHGHHGSIGYVYRGGYAVPPYSRSSFGGYLQSQSYGYGYGNAFGYQPRIQQNFAPNYRSYSGHQRGGLHIDIGRFHVLGICGRH